MFLERTHKGENEKVRWFIRQSKAWELVNENFKKVVGGCVNGEQMDLYRHTYKLEVESKLTCGKILEVWTIKIIQWPLDFWCEQLCK